MSDISSAARLKMCVRIEVPRGHVGLLALSKVRQGHANACCFVPLISVWRELYACTLSAVASIHTYLPTNPQPKYPSARRVIPVKAHAKSPETNFTLPASISAAVRCRRMASPPSQPSRPASRIFSKTLFSKSGVQSGFAFALKALVPKA